MAKGSGSPPMNLDCNCMGLFLGGGGVKQLPFFYSDMPSCHMYTLKTRSLHEDVLHCFMGQSDPEVLSQFVVKEYHACAVSPNFCLVHGLHGVWCLL